jgi:hypothetical protein
MAQVWIAIFFILLASAELYQSVKDITLPFPIYLVLGVVLAVAANYQQGAVLNGQSQQVTLQEIVEADPVLGSVQSPILMPAQQNEKSSIETSS